MSRLDGLPDNSNAERLEAINKKASAILDAIVTLNLSGLNENLTLSFFHEETIKKIAAKNNIFTLSTPDSKQDSKPIFDAVNTGTPNDVKFQLGPRPIPGKKLNGVKQQSHIEFLKSSLTNRRVWEKFKILAPVAEVIYNRARAYIRFLIHQTLFDAAAFLQFSQHENNGSVTNPDFSKGYVAYNTFIKDSQNSILQSFFATQWDNLSEEREKNLLSFLSTKMQELENILIAALPELFKRNSDQQSYQSEQRIPLVHDKKRPSSVSTDEKSLQVALLGPDLELGYKAFKSASALQAYYPKENSPEDLNLADLANKIREIFSQQNPIFIIYKLYDMKMKYLKTFHGAHDTQEQSQKNYKTQQRSATQEFETLAKQWGFSNSEINSIIESGIAKIELNDERLRDDLGNTLLHVAMKGYADSLDLDTRDSFSAKVMYLLRQGALPDITNKENQNAYVYAGLEFESIPNEWLEILANTTIGITPEQRYSLSLIKSEIDWRIFYAWFGEFGRWVCDRRCTPSDHIKTALMAVTASIYHRSNPLLISDVKSELAVRNTNQARLPTKSELAIRNTKQVRLLTAPPKPPLELLEFHPIAASGNSQGYGSMTTEVPYTKLGHS